MPTVTASDGTVGAIISADDKFCRTKNGTLRKINRNGTNGSIGLSRMAQLWKTPVCSDAANREFYCNSRGEPNLSAQVKLWPTPRTQSKSGTGPSRTGHRADLQTAVMLFPTVTTREYKGGRNPDTLAKSGRTITNSLCDYINAKMYTTVCAGDSVGTNGGGNGASLRTDIGGQLNPDWVDWLMGFPVGWTNIELDMPLPDYDPQYFDTEPNIPRTATGIKNRVDRIICDGNAVVPYQAYPIFKAIAEIERKA